ncbi:MAG TPA: hypothetical protein VHW00_00725 [Thermoanaerobaculia bacterium]|nr:hypothetical protein [Thermoanaerobaculia bacterium]
MKGHPDDEKLDRYAFHPDAISDRDAIEEHLRDCRECGEYVAAIRAFAEHISHRESWLVDLTFLGKTQSPKQIAKFVEALRIEDEAASVLLDPLIASPAAFREAAVHDDPRLHTAGAVRYLVGASISARETQPMHAQHLADSAVVIAEQLSSASYDRDLILDLQGNAWCERANALRYLGEYPAALVAAEHAARAFKQTRIPEFDLARVDFIRATIFWKMGRHQEALELVRRSHTVFSRYGDAQREVDCGFLEGGILFETKQCDSALTLFLNLRGPVEGLNNPETRARLANNIAAGYQETGWPSLAAPFFFEALRLYEDLGLEIERLRTAWSLGLLAMRTLGATPDVVERLRQVAAGFTDRGSLSDAALVWLDIAEQQILAEEYDGIVELARHLIERFTAVGMLTSAITALQFLRDAALSRHLTAGDIGHLKSFFLRLGREPELPFTPPSLA